MPTSPPQAAATSGSAGAAEPPPANHQQMFRRGRVTSPNAYAAQLRVVNNVRMQRACRYSIKKLAINSIVDTSNYQRLVSGLAGPEFAALISANAGPAESSNVTGRQGEKGGGAGPNVITIGLPGKKGGRGGGGGGGNGANVTNVEAQAVIIQQQASQQQRPNPIMINASIFPGMASGNDIDLKIFQYKKQQAELKRNQLEDDLKVNCCFIII